jgi:protein-S-isoprenylcysteine O-methyltransferase Ste14
MPAGWVTRWRVRAGYPLALLYLFFAAPTPGAIAIGAAIAVVGLAIRAAAAGHLRKLETLTTSGPYAWTRNPLYLGSSFLAAGFAVAGHSWWAAFVIAAYFAVFYPAVMKKEEIELHIRYGAAFDDYAKKVPLFWPKPPRRATGEAADSSKAAGSAPAISPRAGFSFHQYRRNREYQAALGVLFALALVWLRMKLR